MHIALLLALAAAESAPGPALDLETVLRQARPAPHGLAVNRQLTAAASELGLTRGQRIEAPTVGVETGPRHAPEGDEIDLAVALDLPIAADRAEHHAAREALARARRDLPAAAAVEDRLALALAFVDAWEAGEAVALGEREVVTVDAWRAAVVSRVAAGAEAPFETTLVAAEARQARLALAAGRERLHLAWANLRSLADLPMEPAALRPPQAPAPPDPAPSLHPTLLAQAVASQAALDAALAALAAARADARWSFGASLAREGKEQVARVGLGYRVPLAGQAGDRRAALEAQLLEVARTAERATVALEGRLAAAAERRRATGAVDEPTAPEIERTLAALEARVAAGKDRPSQALPLRRQLLSALSAAVASRAAHLRATFEFAALTTAVTP